MRYARVVNVIDRAAFYKNVFSFFPKLNGVAKTNSTFFVPYGAANVFEAAIYNFYVGGINRCKAVTTAKRKIKSFKCNEVFCGDNTSTKI